MLQFYLRKWSVLGTADLNIMLLTVYNGTIQTCVSIWGFATVFSGFRIMQRGYFRIKLIISQRYWWYIKSPSWRDITEHRDYYTFYCLKVFMVQPQTTLWTILCHKWKLKVVLILRLGAFGRCAPSVDHVARWVDSVGYLGLHLPF